jgi:hypothetical protein
LFRKKDQIGGRMGSWGCGEKERGQIIQRSELWVIEERTATLHFYIIAAFRKNNGRDRKTLIHLR